ncbi:MAG: hypothetical protein SFZ23_05195 [Planctomycetota bacterium]|nr:hypothetical protein [Planctomycetota bacterium]
MLSRERAGSVPIAYNWPVGKRQMILVNPAPNSNRRDPSATIPLGPWPAVIDQLANFNTAPEGPVADDAGTGMRTLFGPGMVVQIRAVGKEPVVQALVDLSDEEIAWPVLSKICKQLGWAMVDVNSGRMFG